MDLATEFAQATEPSTPRRQFLDSLISIVGRRYVQSRSGAMRKYTRGFRVGAGDAQAVVRPGTLLELWKVSKACVAARKIIIMQAANTGLTGGSTPHESYDRDVVIINTMRLTGLFPIQDGKQVVCLPGSTLYDLEKRLQPFGRDPHSKIGSSCIGASVLGGVCNNSGGALVRRGPAYTEAALFARVSEDGELHLVNHLGLTLGDNEEDMLKNLERGHFVIEDSDQRARTCSRTDYTEHVQDVEADTPARFNADQRGLFEASGSAGKLIVFAVRLDTFEKPEATHVFHIASNAGADLTTLKRTLLKGSGLVPITGEYIHRDMFEAASTYGKDSFWAIKCLGTHRLPMLFSLKAGLDRAAAFLKLPIRQFSESLLQLCSMLLPKQLPSQLRSVGEHYEHHLLLEVDDQQVERVSRLLEKSFPTANGVAISCTEKWAKDLFLHRFVSAGAAIRYDAWHARSQSRLVSLDVALRRNDSDWSALVPDALAAQVDRALFYGHFFCNVFHLDFILKAGVDREEFEEALIAHLSERGAECPAEHNVGHIYEAKPQLSDFYKDLDPTNSLNPGIGRTTKTPFWVPSN